MNRLAINAKLHACGQGGFLYRRSGRGRPMKLKIFVFDCPVSRSCLISSSSSPIPCQKDLSREHNLMAPCDQARYGTFLLYRVTRLKPQAALSVSLHGGEIAAIGHISFYRLSGCRISVTKQFARVMRTWQSPAERANCSALQNMQALSLCLRVDQYTELNQFVTHIHFRLNYYSITMQACDIDVRVHP